MPLDTLDPTQPHIRQALVSIWNRACGSDLAITERFIAYNTRPPTGGLQAGRIVMEKGTPVGFVLASALPGDPSSSPPELGWVDAIAVLPDKWKQGMGSELLGWAEGWLRAQGCTTARLGGSHCTFTPGYPADLGDEDFFVDRGYRERAGSGRVWDVARDLRDYAAIYPNHPEVEIRPARAEEMEAVLAYFRREFPQRWRFEFDEFLRARGRPSDIVILLTERGVDGFARLTFEDSVRPIERFYLHRFPHPWGQLGPLGVSKDMRGRGYGGRLIDMALQHLHSHGIRGCVIDWTSLLDLYGKFGFRPFREYAMLLKAL